MGVLIMSKFFNYQNLKFNKLLSIILIIATISNGIGSLLLLTPIINPLLLNKSTNINNIDSNLSFISDKEAGDFLAWLSNVDYVGPINAASYGSITIKEIIEYIEKSTGKKMIISSDGINGKYNGIFDSNLDISRVESLGFKFNNIKEYIFNLLEYYTDICITKFFQS